MAGRDYRYGRCRDRLHAIAESTTLDPDDARQTAVETLRRAIGFEQWCWPLTDPDSGLSTSGIGELEFWPALPRLVALEEHGDITSKPSLILGDRASISLGAATGGDLSRSLRWRECLQPYGVGDEVMTVCRDQRGCWGSLEIMREPSDGHFDPEEQLFLNELAPTLGRLVRRSLLSGVGAQSELCETPTAATLIVDRDGRPVSWTASFEEWLAVLQVEDGMFPPAVFEIAARALRSRDSRTGLPNRVRVRTRFGRFAAIEGALLDGAAPLSVAITIRDATTGEIFDLLCKVYDLTRRERELVDVMLEGLATKQLAQVLSITPYTVQDHLKAVFAKTGARNRAELISLLSGRSEQLRRELFPKRELDRVLEGQPHTGREL
jgi:DNA-binding CsgD family transcriptional regulator